MKQARAISARWTVQIAACAACALYWPAAAQSLSPGDFMPGAARGAEADLEDPGDMAAGMGVAPGRYGPPAGARKITDGALSCQAIFDEVSGLQKKTEETKAALDAVQKNISTATSKMMGPSSGGTAGIGVGSSIASSLLGMIPGGSMLSSASMAASVNARQAAMQDSVKSMMQSQTRAMDLQRDLAYTEARNDHLVDLFLKKKCTPPSQ